jgi:hypothetical protein
VLLQAAGPADPGTRWAPTCIFQTANSSWQMRVPKLVFGGFPRKGEVLRVRCSSPETPLRKSQIPKLGIAGSHCRSLAQVQDTRKVCARQGESYGSSNMADTSEVPRQTGCPGPRQRFRRRGDEGQVGRRRRSGSLELSRAWRATSTLPWSSSEEHATLLSLGLLRKESTALCPYPPLRPRLLVPPRRNSLPVPIVQLVPGANRGPVPPALQQPRLALRYHPPPRTQHGIPKEGPLEGTAAPWADSCCLANDEQVIILGDSGVGKTSLMNQYVRA